MNTLMWMKACIFRGANTANKKIIASSLKSRRGWLHANRINGKTCSDEPDSGLKY